MNYIRNPPPVSQVFVSIKYLSLWFHKGGINQVQYLNNYIVWNSLVNFAKETYQEKAALFLNYVLTATLSERFEDVADRPPLPK